MDPNATWKAIEDAIYEGEAAQAAPLIEDLIEWMRKGGFPPSELNAMPPLYFLGLLKEACRQC
jgi:hypothetical protein